MMKLIHRCSRGEAAFCDEVIRQERVSCRLFSIFSIKFVMLFSGHFLDLAIANSKLSVYRFS